jgi:hypothetical protein
MTLWLQGSPWYFYYVFMGVKLPAAVVAGFAVGLPQLFRRRLGDGRYFLLFWLFFWFFPFTLLGGKFTRYFTFALPVVLITAALGVEFVAGKLAALLRGEAARTAARALVAVAVVALSAYAAVGAMPHYRLYTNALGGGRAAAGYHFPHDEFYDASTGDVAAAVARLAPPGARVASETPELLAYYMRQAGREDLRSVSLSDPAALREFRPGDLIVVARGRRYFSNDGLTRRLAAAAQPAAALSLGGVPSARVYALDAGTVGLLAEAAGR